MSLHKRSDLKLLNVTNQDVYLGLGWGALLICMCRPCAFPTCIILRYLMSDWNRNGIRLQTMTVMRLRNNEIENKSRAVWRNQIVAGHDWNRSIMRPSCHQVLWRPVKITRTFGSIFRSLHLFHLLATKGDSWKNDPGCSPWPSSPFSVYSQSSCALATCLYLCHYYQARHHYLWVIAVT